LENLKKGWKNKNVGNKVGKVCYIFPTFFITNFYNLFYKKSW